MEFIQVNIGEGEHKRSEFLARNPLATIPVLELDDGRYVAESRAICTYLEARYPKPNLMGQGGEERAFIEMIDRQVEFQLYGKLANFLRHTHPGLAVLEQPQFPDFGASECNKFGAAARWLDGRLAASDYVAGDRFTIADITAFCTRIRAPGEVQSWGTGATPLAGLARPHRGAVKCKLTLSRRRSARDAVARRVVHQLMWPPTRNGLSTRSCKFNLEIVD